VVLRLLESNQFLSFSFLSPLEFKALKVKSNTHLGSGHIPGGDTHLNKVVDPLLGAGRGYCVEAPWIEPLPWFGHHVGEGGGGEEAHGVRVRPRGGVEPVQ